MPAVLTQKLEKARRMLQRPSSNPETIIGLLTEVLQKNDAPWVAFHMMGMAYFRKKSFDEAVRYFKKAITKGSKNPGTFLFLSKSLLQTGKFQEAEEKSRRAVQIKEDYFEGWMQLGEICRARGKLNEALACYQKANQIDSKSAEVAFRIARIYGDQSNHDKALQLFDIALKIDEKYLDAYAEKAKLLIRMKRYEEAERCLKKSLQIDKRFIKAEGNLAELAKMQGDYEQAIAIYKKLVNAYPELSSVRVNYALCLLETGQFDESEQQYLQAFRNDPSVTEALSNYLMGLHYNPKRTKEEIFEAHKLYDRQYAPEQKPGRPTPTSLEKDKRLKLGFLSSGFRSHPVGWMITSALEQLPRDQFEIYCYTTNSTIDFLTKRIHNRSDTWRSVIGYSEEVIADMMRKDEIDILVELSGHSADNRLKTVYHEPAPIIVKWVGGLFNTTGLDAVDFLISDRYETPEGEEAFYSEKLVRMPDDYICFLPPEYAPDVGELPALKNGFITFGCFNNPTKVNDQILGVWAEILNEVPNSRLFLKSKQYDTAAVRERIIEILANYGISKERIRFEGVSPHGELLDSYNRVDIALDPWPYSGGLTTCESLWMGVPVITKPGPTFAGRHSTSHLINAGFSEWVKDSWKEYVSEAVSLSNDLNLLAKTRQNLRDKVWQSPLCNAPKFGKNLSKAFREMWNQYVDGQEKNLPEGEWQNHIKLEAEPLNGIKKANKVGNKQDHENEEHVLKQNTTEIAEEAISTKNGSGKEAEFKNGLRANVAPPKKNRDKKQDTLKIEIKGGVTICTPADIKMMTPYVLLEKKDWFENEIRFIRGYLQEGMNMIDVGAGFGVYALTAAKIVGEEGNVFAFEPAEVAKNHLEMGRLENDLNNMEVIGKAISDKSGKEAWKTSDLPESSKLDNAGEIEVSAVTLDSWWHFEGKPEINLIKVDINGHELEALRGAAQLLRNENPLLLLNISEKRSYEFASVLSQLEYKLYEYIPGPGILAEHDPNAETDPYLQNVIAVHQSQLEELKHSDWLHDESVSLSEINSGLWKKELAKQPWTSGLMQRWEGHGNSEEIKLFLKALNHLIASETINVYDSEIKQPRSLKTNHLLTAAQILIGLNNRGFNGAPVIFTLIRALVALGRQNEAVELLNKFVVTTNMGQQNMNVDLPFLLPVPDQDHAAVKTDLTKWLTVRTVEAWILLKDLTTYFSGPQEEKLMDVLQGNPEALPGMKQVNESDFFRFKTHDRGAKIVHQNSFSRDWFQTLFNMIMHVRPLNVQSHNLPSELIVSLTSYPERFKTLHLTLASLLNQSIKPDRVILWIAYEDENQLPDSILKLKKAGLEIRFTKDIKSYKKIIPTLKAFPNAFIATADDDVYYWQTWLEELVEAWKKHTNCVTAHRVHRARVNSKGSFEPYERWSLNFSNDLSPNELNFPTGIAGVLYPPGVFHQDVLNEEIFMEVCPHGDDIWLYWMYRLNGVEVKITGTNRVPLTWPSTQESALWKENLGNGRNDLQIEKISSKYGVPVNASSEPIFTVRSRGGNYKMLLPQWKTDHIQRIISNSGRPYEEKMLYDMLNRVKEGDLILDIGANIGNHSLFMASIGKCKVMSFEPNKHLAESLLRSIQINKLSNNIEVIQKGLGKKYSFAEFESDISHNLGAQSLSTTDKNGSIEVVTLDSLDIQEKVRLIKIDVEGMELDVLKGSEETLKEYKPLLYLEAEKQEDFKLLNHFLEKLGYKYQATFNATPTHLFTYRASS